MTLVALLFATQNSATAAEFFPLVPGERRVYEIKKGNDKMTYIDEVGDKTAFFDGQSATPIVQKSQFNQTISTAYYRVDGGMVLLVGSAEDRTASTPTVGGDKSIDLTKKPDRRNVLLQLTPPMPVFRFDGGATTWRYGDIPVLKAAGNEEPIKTDKTLINGTAKLGPTKTVLGRKVETLEVRADVQLGEGDLAQKIVETSVYGRGIGLIEAVRKESGGGKKASETRTTLMGIEKKEGG